MEAKQWTAVDRGKNKGSLDTHKKENISLTLCYFKNISPALPCHQMTFSDQKPNYLYHRRHKLLVCNINVSVF